MTGRRSLEQLSRELKNQLRQKGGWDNLSKSVNQIAGMITTIAETEGGEWMDKIQSEGGDQEKEENQRLYNSLQPHVQDIRNYIRGNTSQQGGENPSSTEIPPPFAQKGPLASESSQVTDSAQPMSMMSMMPSIDLDAAFTGLIQKTDQLNQTAEYLSSQYGLTRLERDFDTQGDFQVIPNFLTTMIGSTGPTGMAAKQFLDKIKVPYRFIVFLVYLYLDISRLTASTMGYTTQQKVLTVVLALLELFRGDWKKAILTFMGFYGSTPLLAGQIGKALLYLFERLSPTIQDRMVYGAWDASKSLLVGVLLSIFQLTAPLSVRQPFMEMLEILAKGKREVDDTLIEAGLEPRSDDFEPTWENINRLQAVNRDPVFICSCEYQEVIKNIGDSALIKLILQLLGLPVNEEMKKKYTCVDRMPCKPFVEALRAEQTPQSSSSAPNGTLSVPSASPPAPPPPFNSGQSVSPPPFNSGPPAPPPFNSDQSVSPPPFNSGQSVSPPPFNSGPPAPPPFNSGQPSSTTLNPLPQQAIPQQAIKGGRITRYQKKRSTKYRVTHKKRPHQRVRE